MMKRVIADGRYALLLSLTDKATYVLLFAILARITSTEQFGTIVSTFAIAAIVSAAAELGFTPYMQRSVAGASATAQDDLSSILWLKSVLLVPYFLLLAGIHAVFVFPFTPVVALIGLLVYSSSIASLFIRTLYGKSDYRTPFIITVYCRAVFAIGALAVFSSYRDGTFLLILLLISTILQAVWTGMSVHERVVRVQWKFLSNTLLSVLRRSYPMGAGMVFVWIYDRADVLVIRSMLDADAVAVYAVAYSVYKAPHITAGAVLTPLFTRLSAEFSRNGYVLLRSISDAALSLSVIVLLSVVVIGTGAEMILRQIYGEGYGASAPTLRMLLIALPFLFFNNLTGVMLNSVGKEHAAFRSAVFAMVVNVAVNVLLLPQFGIIAAVAATVLAEGIVFVLQCTMLIRSGLIKRMGP